MSLSEEWNKIAQKTLSESRKRMEEKFKASENFAKFCLGESLRLCREYIDTCDVFKSKHDEAITKDDLESMLLMVTRQSAIQSALALANSVNTRKQKEITFGLIEFNVMVLADLLPPIIEAIPNVEKEAQKIIGERLGKLEKEIRRLKKHKGKLAIEIASEYDEALELITEWIERTKKAAKAYVK